MGTHGDKVLNVSINLNPNPILNLNTVSVVLLNVEIIFIMGIKGDFYRSPAGRHSIKLCLFSILNMRISFNHSFILFMYILNIANPLHSSFNVCVIINMLYTLDDTRNCNYGKLNAISGWIHCYVKYAAGIQRATLRHPRTCI